MYPIEVPSGAVAVSISDVVKVFNKASLSVLVVDTVPTVNPAFVIAVFTEFFVVP